MRLIGMALACLTVLLVATVAAWLTWFRNSYHDAPLLDPAELFPPNHAEQMLLVTGAQWLDLDSGNVRPDTHVVVRGDYIERVGRGEVDTAGFDRVLDADGRFLLPGLIDLHIHVNTGGIASREPLTARFCLESLVRYGVTTALWLGGSSGNDRETAEIKALQQAHRLVAPVLFGTGDMITVPGSHPITTGSRYRVGMSFEELRETGVIRYTSDLDIHAILSDKRELGLDAVKIVIEDGPEPWYPKPRMSFDDAKRITEAAHAIGLRVFAHISGVGEMEDAVAAGVDAVMHSAHDRRLGDADLNLIQRMRDVGVLYVPTFSIAHGFALARRPDDLEDRFLQAGVSRRALRSLENPIFLRRMVRMGIEFDATGILERQLANLAFLHTQGVRIGMGSDSSELFDFPGYSAHVELARMVEAGMTPLEALRSATRVAADFLESPHLGRIRPGAVANLLLLDENPLDDIRHTRTLYRVVLQGAVIEPVRTVDSTRGDQAGTPPNRRLQLTSHSAL